VEETAEEMPVQEEVKLSRPISKPMPAMPAKAARTSPSAVTPSAAPRKNDNLLEIEPEEGGLAAIISQLKTKP
jgi:hypothetical protein